MIRDSFIKMMSEAKLHKMVREIKSDVANRTKDEGSLAYEDVEGVADGSGSRLSKIRKAKAHKVLDELLDDVEVKVLALRRGIKDIKGV